MSFLMHFLTREFVDSTLSAKAPVSWITLSRKVDEKRRVSPVINLLRSSGGAKSSFSLSLSLILCLRVMTMIQGFSSWQGIAINATSLEFQAGKQFAIVFWGLAAGLAINVFYLILISQHIRWENGEERKQLEQHGVSE